MGGFDVITFGHSFGRSAKKEVIQKERQGKEKHR